MVLGQPKAPVPQTIKDEKARQTEEEKEKKLRREMEVQSLVLSAKSQPAEIAADVLFSVLEKKLITDPKKQQELIEYIYRIASDAKEPFQVSSPGAMVDTRTGYRASAAYQKLDQLSIELQAVKLMLPLNKQKARELFRDIPALKFALTCEDALDYEISDFYVVLNDIVEQTFDSEARLRKDEIYFAASYLDAIDSPEQIVPALNFLFKVKTTPQDFDVLLNSFTTSLRKMRANARGFAFLMKYPVTRLIKDLAQGKVDPTSSQSAELRRAYRSYLATNLSSVQCADSLITATKEKPNPIIEAANELFASPLTGDDIKPEKIEPGAKIFEYWHTPKTAKLLTNIRELRFGHTQKNLTLEERSTPEWQQSLMKFLEQMNDWRPEDEATETDYLHQRCVLYDGLIDLTPPGPMLSAIFQNYALYLRDSRMQKESPIQWLNYVKRVLRTGKNNLKGKDRDEFENVLSSAGHSVFNLYIDLERLQSTEVPPVK